MDYICRHCVKLSCDGCERKQPPQAISVIIPGFQEMQEENEKLKRENARLREALEWYADQKNYSLNRTTVTCDRSYSVIFDVQDIGSRARKALERKE